MSAPDEQKTKLRLEIAHVLFIDIVGYSKLLITEQSELLRKLTEVVRETEQFRAAEAEGKLVRLPTGDGMALVFRSSPEAPVECALELSQRLKSQAELRVRMGIHSGPVNEVTDVNERTNITGAGINIAQRVMDCGDARHILLSKRVADDLEQYRQWRPHLHDLGEVEVKHGVKIDVVNFCDGDLGNPELPEKIRRLRRMQAMSGRRRRLAWSLGAIALVLALGAAFWFQSRRAESTHFAAASFPNKSIAVLPFENLSEEKANAYFADGVQDEILTDLAKVADLKVISRSSVMHYKSGVERNLREIGQQLGAAHLLEGSVQRANNRIRVNAQLIDARTDAHLWAQTYDRDLADVFAIQSEIAKAIADQLQAKLSPNEKNAIEQPPTTDVTAFDLYSRAKSIDLTISFSANRRVKLLQAVDLLNQAVARDPSFFLAYCALADAQDTLYFFGGDRTAERLSLAEAAIQAAFRLRPDAGEVHLVHAQHLYHGYFDYDGALAELEIARRTLPHNPRVIGLAGYIALRQGKYEEGLHQLERSLEMDPQNFVTLQSIASTYRNLRKYPEQRAFLKRALAIRPDDADTQVALAWVDLEENADPSHLHQTIASIRQNNPAALSSIANTWIFCALAERDVPAGADALAALGESPFSFDAARLTHSFAEGLLARMVNDDAKAQSAFTTARAQQVKLVQSQPDYGPALCALGLIDAGLARKEEALSEGRRAIELMPMEKDAYNGAYMVVYFAVISAWVGEKNIACEQLENLIRQPSPISYGQLKLLPYWDPLRGDPRFEKIVASLAPKETEK